MRNACINRANVWTIGAYANLFRKVIQFQLIYKWINVFQNWLFNPGHQLC